MTGRTLNQYAIYVSEYPGGRLKKWVSTGGGAIPLSPLDWFPESGRLVPTR
jgi:hypothetical protein